MFHAIPAYGRYYTGSIVSIVLHNSCTTHSMDVRAKTRSGCSRTLTVSFFIFLCKNICIYVYIYVCLLFIYMLESHRNLVKGNEYVACNAMYVFEGLLEGCVVG